MDRSIVHNKARISPSLLRDAKSVVGSIYRMNAPGAIGYAFTPVVSGKSIAHGMFIDHPRELESDTWTYYWEFKTNTITEVDNG